MCDNKITRDRSVHCFAMCDCPVWCIKRQTKKGKWKFDYNHGMWFTAEEAQREIDAHPHENGGRPRMPYGLFARGDLKKILTSHTETQEDLEPQW